jgi:hypothetical protein
MNLRTVLRTYALLRQLTDDESALLETLRGMSEGERELLVESLSPEKPTKPATAKTFERCVRCGNTKHHNFHKDSSTDGFHEFQVPVVAGKKSQRAASLAEKVGGTLASIAKTVGGDDEGARRFIGALCMACSHDEDYEDHQQPSPHYHPFASSSSARGAARGSSSKNDGSEESTASSETGQAGVTSAAHVVNGD